MSFSNHSRAFSANLSGPLLSGVFSRALERQLIELVDSAGDAGKGRGGDATGGGGNGSRGTAGELRAQLRAAQVGAEVRDAAQRVGQLADHYSEVIPWLLSFVPRSNVSRERRSSRPASLSMRSAVSA